MFGTSIDAFTSEGRSRTKWIVANELPIQVKTNVHKKYINNLVICQFIIGSIQIKFHLRFILDRGYFDKENVHFMDKNNEEFVIMVK